LGTKHLTDFPDRIYKWAVPFTSGKLVAKGKYNGHTVETERITAGPPVAIQLTADRKSLRADGKDVAHIVAMLVDKSGVPVKTENRQITFDIEGIGRVLGVDNGAVNSVQDYQSNRVVTDQGCCLLIVQSRTIPSILSIDAKATDLESNSLQIRVE